MILKYITDLAAQKNIREIGISIEDGTKIGCKDMHLVNLRFKGKNISILVSQSDVNQITNGSNSDRLEVQIRSALDRLACSLDS
jgi:hypothetical protein